MGAQSGKWGSGAGSGEQKQEVGAGNRKCGPGAGSGGQELEVGVRSGKWGPGAGSGGREQEAGVRSGKWGLGAGSGGLDAQPVSGAAHTLTRTLQGQLCASWLPPALLGRRWPHCAAELGVGPLLPWAAWPSVKCVAAPRTWGCCGSPPIRGAHEDCRSLCCRCPRPPVCGLSQPCRASEGVGCAQAMRPAGRWGSPLVRPAWSW